MLVRIASPRHQPGLVPYSGLGLVCESHDSIMPPPHGERGDGAHRVVRDVRALGRERVLEVDELEADGLEQRARRVDRAAVRGEVERAVPVRADDLDVNAELNERADLARKTLARRARESPVARHLLEPRVDRREVCARDARGGRVSARAACRATRGEKRDRFAFAEFVRRRPRPRGRRRHALGTGGAGACRAGLSSTGLAWQRRAAAAAGLRRVLTFDLESPPQPEAEAALVPALEQRRLGARLHIGRGDFLGEGRHLEDGLSDESERLSVACRVILVGRHKNV